MIDHCYCNVTGKVCYSQKEAGNVIRRLKRHRIGITNKKIPMRTYYCKYCGTYHLTHFKQRKRHYAEKRNL